MSLTGLVGHWPLQDSGGGTSITAIVGAIPVISGGKTSAQMNGPGPGSGYPRSLYFNGTGGDFLDISPVGYLVSRPKYSATFYANLPVITGSESAPIISINDAVNEDRPRFAGFISRSGSSIFLNLEVTVSGAVQTTTTPALSNTSGWHHYLIGVNHFTQEVALWIDGRTSVVSNLSMGPSSSGTNPLTFRVGREYINPVIKHARTYIADLRLYNDYPDSSGEVQEIINEGTGTFPIEDDDDEDEVIIYGNTILSHDALPSGFQKIGNRAYSRYKRHITENTIEVNISQQIHDGNFHGSKKIDIATISGFNSNRFNHYDYYPHP